MGVGANCKMAGVMPGEFRDFIEGVPNKGLIFIAFGTYPDWSFAPNYMRDAIFGAINRLEEYRVIFVYNGPPVEVKEHIKLVKWAPQLEILAHPKTVAFITHTGMKRFQIHIFLTEIIFFRIIEKSWNKRSIKQ